jgi:hypothetical protein
MGPGAVLALDPGTGAAERRGGWCFWGILVMVVGFARYVHDTDASRIDAGRSRPVYANLATR